VAGIARIVIGIVLVIIGIPFLLIIVGIIPLIIGIVLIASGVSARGDAERLQQQQAQTNMLLQQQLQMNAMQASRQAAPAQYPPAQQYAPAAPSGVQADRYCPACGTGNARAAAFCQKCGKPLPPPP
jgi:ABC-type bacteriocin/lantibiotic exporter with double-glycine peptidase domain